LLKSKRACTLAKIPSLRFKSWGLEVPTPQDFISPSLDKCYQLFLQVIVAVVIDVISPKGTYLLVVVEGIDQTTIKLYFLKLLLTSSNPGLD
jgi:hypothetical protein